MGDVGRLAQPAGRDLLEVPRTISESLETGSIFVPPPIEAVKKWPLIGEPLFQFWELASSNLKAALQAFTQPEAPQ